MTITQQSAQKALDALAPINFAYLKEFIEWCNEQHPENIGLKSHTALTIFIDHHATIRAALQHFAQPSGEGVDYDEMAKELMESEERNSKSCAEIVRCVKKIMDLERQLSAKQYPASPPDAVIAGAIEALEMAKEHLSDKGIFTCADKCGDAIKALRALPARQDGWRFERDEEAAVKMVGKAMADAWNDICSDTDCHPIDIKQLGRRRLMFQPDHWARLTAYFLSADIIKMSPPSTSAAGPENAEGG